MSPTGTGVFPGRRALGILAAALLLLCAPGAGAQAADVRYFVSNALGSPLDEIGWWRREEFPYVLAVELHGELEVRRLLHEGRETRRWERSPSQEQQFVDGRLDEQLLFDSRGRTVEERLFEAGTLASRRVVHYGPQGPLRAELFDAQGRLLYEDRFLLSSRGELLRVVRQAPEGERQELALAGRAGRIYEERHSAGAQAWVNRYDAQGRRVETERWAAGASAPVETQRLEYGEAGLKSVRTSELGELGESGRGSRRDTVETYDENGRLSAVVVELNGQRIRETRLLRDAEGRLVEKQSRGEDGLEQWLYAYGPEGVLQREQYSQRGALRSVTVYGAEDSRVEELYRDGEVVLRVHFAGGRKVREETVVEGEVVRVKEFP